jgi:PIN domain nuclease of toxin-antitoxin system
VTVAADNFTELPFTLRHAEELERLPQHHGDPFDRILVAQARVESAIVVTRDRAFEKYGVAIIWT